MNYRISNSTRAFLIGGALIADLAQLLLAFLWFTIVLSILAFSLSIAITIFILTIYWYIFTTSMVTPFTTKSLSLTLLSECMPIVGEFMPSLTWWTWRVIHTSRIEDEARAAEDAKLEEAQKKQFLLLHKQRRSDVVAQRAANDNARAGATQEEAANDNTQRSGRRLAA